MARRVLIVDDYAPFREVAGALLRRAGYDVVGEAADGTSAVVAAERLRPNIVLLDVQLPDEDGFVVAERLAALDHPPAVVLTSTRDTGAYRRRVATSPVLGFVAKVDLSAATLAALVD